MDAFILKNPPESKIIFRYFAELRLPIRFSSEGRTYRR
jgi:hypothetical protein